MKKLVKEKAFLLFCYAIDTVYQPYYFEDMKGVKHDINVANELIKFRFPALHDYLTQKDLSIDNTVLSWTICLFMNMNLNESVKAELLEFILVYKKAAIYKIIIYCIKKVKKRLLTCTNIVDCNQILREVEKHLDRDDISGEIIKVKVDDSIIKELIRLECQQFHNDQYVFKEENLDLKSCMIKNYFYMKNHHKAKDPKMRYSQLLKVNNDTMTLTKTIFQRYRIFTISDIYESTTLNDK